MKEHILLNVFTLFFAAVAGGSLFLFLPVLRKISFRNILMLAGSYLFSITIIHILPEVYIDFPNPVFIGIFILTGFFLQLILAYFSRGIEHGHLHVHAADKEGIHFHTTDVMSLMVGLGVHSFLEGMILSQPQDPAFNHQTGGVLLGIILHKIPAAFSLMALLYYSHIGKLKCIGNLVLFSLMSPAGLIFNHFVNQSAGLPGHYVSMLYGVVSGTFLYISTTIFFETSPGHHFNLKKLLYALAGAAAAIAVELII